MAMYYSYGQETVAILRRMIYDGHMITGDECGPNFLTFVLRLRENTGKNLNQEIDPIGDRTRTRCMRSNDVTPTPQRWSLNFVSNILNHSELWETLCESLFKAYAYFKMHFRVKYSLEALLPAILNIVTLWEFSRLIIWLHKWARLG